ncbi:MAG: hypothetical protein JRI96_02390 [Deltaproteobacteria bacterium]|nr:hypothetical protein [Deltaproteobacteria bacterium]
MKKDSQGSEGIIGTISNKNNPAQTIAIKYLRQENAFVTSGIKKYLGTKEILVPVYLVASDFELIGTIISAILEKISVAREAEATFRYAQRFEVLGKLYTLSNYAEYVKLDRG